MAAASASADRELEKRVVSFLAGRHVPGLRHVQVRARDGVVTLSGQVKSFYEKQLCGDCCRRVAGVVTFVDEVNVADDRRQMVLV
jgi:osmotically-inducible protein OsmY